MKKRPTVIDVAELAQVGASTVSRVVRGVSVRPDVSERVLRAIKTLGYEADETARALRGGRTNTIGVILPKVSNAFFSQAMQFMEEEAGKRGCTVILLTHQDRMTEQVKHLATLRRCRVDGVVLTGASGTSLKDVRSELPDVPIVAFDSSFSSKIDSVILMNREAARTATEHLLKHGYKRLACITGKPDNFSFHERLAGYSETMLAYRLEPWLITAPDYEQLRRLVSIAIKGKNPPDAILSLSDFATLNVFTVFKELSLKPTKRPPMIGFDDFGFAPLFDPPITVIRQPIENMVSETFNVLFRRIDATSKKATQEIALPAELIRRQSCGCP